MSVNLQVVGIFYREEINTDNISGLDYSVKQIMDAAVRNGGTSADGVVLDYSFATVYSGAPNQPNKNYVDFISASYPAGATSPVSGNTYNAGTYALSQTFSNFAVASYTVWQYYIFDANQTKVSAGSTAETPFDMTTAVKDGYTIVWRLVTVCAQPVTLNARVSALLSRKAGPASPLVASASVP